MLVVSCCRTELACTGFATTWRDPRRLRGRGVRDLVDGLLEAGAERGGAGGELRGPGLAGPDARRDLGGARAQLVRAGGDPPRARGERRGAGGDALRAGRAPVQAGREAAEPGGEARGTAAERSAARGELVGAGRRRTRRRSAARPRRRRRPPSPAFWSVSACRPCWICVSAAFVLRAERRIREHLLEAVVRVADALRVRPHPGGQLLQRRPTSTPRSRGRRRADETPFV